ncbi:hypothetical protein V6N12_067164 [Hibiscus sabdariffa]|uniref:Uncharacterized protein n=1 Tax=Hibiscus sabdariffa TaxID=183260 RepID=A0ABR2BUT3_9ROSI
MEIPPTPLVEIDSEDTIVVKEEESESIPQPPLASTPVKRRSVKRTAGRILVEEDKPSPATPRSEEEVQSSADEEDRPTIIPPIHPMSIKRKVTKRARCSSTKVAKELKAKLEREGEAVAILRSCVGQC